MGIKYQRDHVARSFSSLLSHTMNRLKAVDFFCGAGGMSYGLTQAGIHVIAGIDNATDCKATYMANIPTARYIKRDIARLSAPELARRIGITSGDPMLIFCGCSPCQFWSKIRTDKRKSERTAYLLRQFQRFIRYFQPGFVVVENVPGLYNRKDESILPDFTKFLSECGYIIANGIVNANHYGVPQNRVRYLLVASNIVTELCLPKADNSRTHNVIDYIGIKNGFERICAGHRDQTAFLHTAARLSEQNQKRISLTSKSGGTRRAWSDDPELQISAYKGKDHIFADIYGRMSWDKPAPTITTRFISFSNGRFGHPDEDRAISLREGATLQTFPKTYAFHGSSMSQLARQIGNAVPPELARRIGEYIITVASNG